MLWWKDETGAFRNQLPANLYGASLSITDAVGAPVRLAPGLNPAFASRLAVPVFALYQGKLFYRPLVTGSPLFSVSHVDILIEPDLVIEINACYWHGHEQPPSAAAARQGQEEIQVLATAKVRMRKLNKSTRMIQTKFAGAEPLGLSGGR
jgi:hypothetical protein